MNSPPVAPSPVLTSAYRVVSGPRLLSIEAVRSMARPRIVMALANPVPEIDPYVAGPEVDVMATGRSDHPTRSTTSSRSPAYSAGCSMRARAP